MKLLKTLKALKNTIMRRLKPNSQRYAIIKDDKIHVNTLNRGIIIVLPYEEVEEFLGGYEFQYKPQYGQEFNVNNYEFIKNLGFWGNDLVGGETTTFVNKEPVIVNKVEEKVAVEALEAVEVAADAVEAVEVEAEAVEEVAAEEEVIPVPVPVELEPQYSLIFNEDSVYEQYYDCDSVVRSKCDSNKNSSNNNSSSSSSSSVMDDHVDLVTIEVVVEKLDDPEYRDLASLRAITRAYLDSKFLNSWNVSTVATAV